MSDQDERVAEFLRAQAEVTSPAYAALPSTAEFASGKHRHLYKGEEPTDWIEFSTVPADAKERKHWFAEGSMGHPAKANIEMMRSIWRHVGTTFGHDAGKGTYEGQVLMDFFGGTGTSMMATLEGYKVILCELEPTYINLIKESMKKISSLAGWDISANVLLLEGDNRITIPTARREAFLKWGRPDIHHIMGSPPYAAVLSVSKPKAESTKHLAGSYSESIQVYSDHARSIGKLSKFQYNHEMTKVYKACHDALVPGGTMTTIMKDFMRQGERQYLSKWFEKVCTEDAIGWKDGTPHFMSLQWHKRHSPGTGYLKLHESRGNEVVLDEDIVIFGKAY